MAVDLADHAGTLRRAITPLGSTLFSTIGDDELVQHLVDAFWEAKLDGFLGSYTVSDDGTVAGDFPQANVALLVLYAGVKILRTQILNTNTGFRAKAGPVEFERQNSATMLAEMLKQLARTKERVIAEAQFGATDVLMLDAFSARLYSPELYYGDRMLGG